jgi:hypothetical protein
MTFMSVVSPCRKFGHRKGLTRLRIIAAFGMRKPVDKSSVSLTTFFCQSPVKERLENSLQITVLPCSFGEF